MRALIFILLVSQPLSLYAKNVIFFIADGMGPAQITGARIYAGGSEHRLAMEKLKYTGFAKTYSANHYVTDSAAAATSLATGKKTYNGAIGVDVKGKKLTTLAQLAKQQGRSVGIVSTARITHATPASFYAHVKDRGMEKEIASQLVEASVDIVLGGGREMFLPAPQGRRADSRNLLALAEKKGWQVLTKASELKQTNRKQKVLGLFAESHLPYQIDRKKNDGKGPELKEMVAFAIEALSQNPKGYFLLVEAGRVDHASHDNMAKKTFEEVLALDRAIQTALDKRDKETLIVVTADHETGGLSLLGYGPKEVVKGDVLISGFKQSLTGDSPPFISWGSGPSGKAKHKEGHIKATYFQDSAAHSAVDVPILADGPQAERLSGFHDNTEIALIIADVLGVKL